jgi:hypothetical protein
MAAGHVLISIEVVLGGITLDGWTSEEVESLKAAIKQSLSIVTGIPTQYFGHVVFVSVAPTVSIIMKNSVRSEVSDLRCRVALDRPAAVRMNE